ncbi:MAG: sulfatase-like hydrolase/transferase [bacterium]|nr:sulfatase-like hydrolase/transferase [bacterium]
MSARTRVLSLAWLMGWVCLAGCKPAPSTDSPAQEAASTLASPPNIVLITLCTFRSSHMGAAGYARNTTPYLDSLATRGTFFENAFSASSWTKPATASILTGLTPNVHRMTDYYDRSEILGGGFTPNRVLADDVVMLPESMRAAGYATCCQINNINAGSFFNLTQGFDHTGAHDLNVDTPTMIARFGDWLGGVDSKRPFFFFMLTRDTHITYDPDYAHYLEFNRAAEPVVPSEYPRYPPALYQRIKTLRREKASIPDELKQRWIDLYDAELAQLDHALEAVAATLRRTGRESNTIIIITADHGERFFEHGGVGHGGALDEPVLRIPMIFTGPGVRAGQRLPQVVRSIDLYPTIMSLAGVEAPVLLQGVDLTPLLIGETADFPELTAFSSNEAKKGSYHAVRDRRHKLWVQPDGRRRLFDLDEDPGESRDVLEDKPEIATELDEILLGWRDQEENLREFVRQGGSRTLTPEVLEQLRALGYIQ